MRDSDPRAAQRASRAVRKKKAAPRGEPAAKTFLPRLLVASRKTADVALVFFVDFSYTVSYSYPARTSARFLRLRVIAIAGWSCAIVPFTSVRVGV